MDDLERLGGLPFMDAGPFEHLNVLIKKSLWVTSQRLLTRVCETVGNMKSALESVQIFLERSTWGCLLVYLYLAKESA